MSISFSESSSKTLPSRSARERVARVLQTVHVCHSSHSQSLSSPPVHQFRIIPSPSLRYPCIHSGHVGFFSANPSSSRAPNKFRHQAQKRCISRRAPNPTFPLCVSSKRPTDKLAIVGVRPVPSSSLRTCMCTPHISCQHTVTSSFLITDRGVTRRQRHDQRFYRFPLR